MGDLTRFVLIAESMGPGWTVYRVYGTTVYKICASANEYKLMQAKHVIVHRTTKEEPKPPVVYNRDRWDEREEDVK